MNDVFGYVIMENTNEFATISNIERVKDPDFNLFYIRFDTVLQSLDCVNRNKRLYTKDAMIAGLQHSNITELMAKGKWRGESGHPISDDVRRVAVIDDKLTCHKINKWWIDGNLVKGTIETLDDGMYGTKLAKSILQGMVPSFSLRALARLEKRGNVSYIKQAPHVVAYDEVILPSHPEAYADERKPAQKVFKSARTDKEQVYEDMSSAILASDIKSFITTKSDSLKIICESFDINPTNMSISHGGNAISLKSGGDTIVFALEQAISKEIVNYWGSF